MLERGDSNNIAVILLIVIVVGIAIIMTGFGSGFIQGAEMAVVEGATQVSSASVAPVAIDSVDLSTGCAYIRSYNPEFAGTIDAIYISGQRFLCNPAITLTQGTNEICFSDCNVDINVTAEDCLEIAGPNILSQDCVSVNIGGGDTGTIYEPPAVAPGCVQADSTAPTLYNISFSPTTPSKYSDLDIIGHCTDGAGGSSNIESIELSLDDNLWSSPLTTDCNGEINCGSTSITTGTRTFSAGTLATGNHTVYARCTDVCSNVTAGGASIDFDIGGWDDPVNVSQTAGVESTIPNISSNLNEVFLATWLENNTTVNYATTTQGTWPTITTQGTITGNTNESNPTLIGNYTETNGYLAAWVTDNNATKCSIWDTGLTSWSSTLDCQPNTGGTHATLGGTWKYVGGVGGDEYLLLTSSNQGSDYDLYSARIDVLGETLTDNNITVENTSLDSTDPASAFGVEADNYSVTVWTQDLGGGMKDIYFKKYDHGTDTWTGSAAAITAGSSLNNYADIILDQGVHVGFYGMAVWQNDTTGKVQYALYNGATNTFGAATDITGQPAGTNDQISINLEQFPTNAINKLIVTFANDNNDGDPNTQNMYGMEYDFDSGWGTANLIASFSDDPPTKTALGSDSGSESIVLWEQDPDGGAPYNKDIYAAIEYDGSTGFFSGDGGGGGG